MNKHKVMNSIGAAFWNWEEEEEELWSLPRAGWQNVNGKGSRAKEMNGWG
jgi:hypothetical protein